MYVSGVVMLMFMLINNNNNNNNSNNSKNYNSSNNHHYINHCNNITMTRIICIKNNSNDNGTGRTSATEPFPAGLLFDVAFWNCKCSLRCGRSMCVKSFQEIQVSMHAIGYTLHVAHFTRYTRCT